MSEPLADIGDLLTLLGPSADESKADLVLTQVSNRFRGDVHHHVSHVENDVIQLDGDGTRVLLLPQAPVTDVSEVKVDGDEVEAEWSQHGLIRSKGRFPDRLGAIEVTYSHGYDPIPGDISDIVLERSRYAYHALPGLSSMQVGGQTLSWSAAAAAGVTDEWAKVVEAYRLGRGDEA